MKDFVMLNGVTYDINALLAARLRKSVFKQVLFYLQSFGSENYTHDQAYTHGMFKSPQPTNLDLHATEQTLLDYKESANITGTSEAEVISDFEFVMPEARERETIIQGPCEIGLQLRIRGDGTRTTYLTKVRINLFKRTSAGVDTAIITDAEFDFDTEVSHSANSWDDKVGIKLHSAIAETVLLAADRLVLRVEVFGYVSTNATTNNKIRLYFSRGSAESYMYLPIDEGF